MYTEHRAAFKRTVNSTDVGELRDKYQYTVRYKG
jgi:hypothetical protein